VTTLHEELREIGEKMEANAANEQMMMALAEAVRNAASRAEQESRRLFICERKGDGVEAKMVKW
jgi:hypothetical protein